MDLNDRQQIVDLIKKLGSELTRKRVLLVDRHASVRQNMRSMLAALGINMVQHADTSSEVVRRVQEDNFDIIIADYQLEDDRDGQQLLEELRIRKLILSTTVFIMATAERAHQNVISVAELTPDAYLLKPFTGDDLQSRLVRAVDKKKICRPILDNLDSHLYSDALEACNALLNQKIAYNFDVLRYKGQILNSLGRYQEAHDVYQSIMKAAPLPFAKMGLAKSLRGLGKLSDAEAIADTLVKSNKVFLEAYDFLASLHEEMGQMEEAQQVLQRAAGVSPKNSTRHEVIADFAVRNNDPETAEKSYSIILESRRKSSLRSIDDYTNLARVMLARGRVDSARKISEDLQRDWRDSRDNRQATLASLIVDTLCASREEDHVRAEKNMQKAIELREELLLEGETKISQKNVVDFAHACLATGENELANDLFQRIAAENHENRSVLAHIETAYANEGKTEEGKSLLARVNKEIVKLNNSGVMAAKSGDLVASVNLLIETVERVPNLQFLVNASKAIFTLLSKNGWDEDLADRGVSYLRVAHQKDNQNPRVISACDLYQRVARQMGHEIQAIDQSTSFAW